MSQIHLIEGNSNYFDSDCFRHQTLVNIWLVLHMKILSLETNNIYPNQDRTPPTRRNPLHNQALNRMSVEVNWVDPLSLSAVHPKSSGLAKLAHSLSLRFAGILCMWDGTQLEQTRHWQSSKKRHTGKREWTTDRWRHSGGDKQSRSPSGGTPASVITDNTPKMMHVPDEDQPNQNVQMFHPRFSVHGYKIFT